MNHTHASALVLAVIGGLAVCPAPASEMGMAAANQVSKASYIDYLDNWLFTHDGDNKGPSGPDLVPCRDNIVDFMESYGLSVELEPFNYSGGTYHNVVGTKLGTVYPEQEFIIGAHYDTVSNPGADDNASGVALVLEAARILSQYPSDYTIRFVAFSMEEVGLVGSGAYVDAHLGDDILGMISADMVAYNTGAPAAKIYGHSESDPIKNALAAAIDEYGDGLVPEIEGGLDASNHAPFEWAGFQACLLIESEVWSNPYYHTQDDSFDSPGYLDFDFAVQMVRSVVGWLVDHAGVQVDVDMLKFSYPQGLPEYINPDGTTTALLEVTGMGEAEPMPDSATMCYNTGEVWQCLVLDMIGDNLYEIVFPAADCPTEMLYYFSALDMEGTFYHDPYMAPDVTYSAIAAYGREAFYEEPLDADPGWAMTGEWEFGQPTGQGGTSYGNPDPTSGATGSYVCGVNLNGDYSTSVGGPYTLTTDAIDCTGRMDVELSFQRWLNSDYQPYLIDLVEVSDDGTTWTTVWENGDSEIADADWAEFVYDISDVADDQPTVYVRWSYEVGSTGAWAYSGWNIDDVKLIAVSCESPCPADITGDGVVDVLDLLAVLGAWGDCPGCPEDVTGDGVVDVLDLLEVLAAWGPC